MRLTMIGLMVAGLLVCPAQAEIEEGNSELSLSVSLDNSSTEMTFEVGGTEYKNNSDDKEYSLLSSYGYFFSEAWQAGGSLYLFRFSSIDPEATDTYEDPWTGFLSLFVNYHIIMQDPRIVPYVGAEAGKMFHIGWDAEKEAAKYGGGADDTVEAPQAMGYGIYTGMKYFVTEKTSIGPLLRYRIQSISQTMDIGEEMKFEGTKKSTTLMIQVATLF